MARPLRIEYPGAHYHVMSRGNERQPIVRDDADRVKRLDWLRRAIEMYGWRLHAFVLMENHDHLFVETPDANLSAGMQFLNGSYTSYFNRRHRRCGHLFQGRFKSQLVEEEGYYLEVSRYIHLNPVRAQCVERAQQYRWSSYPGYHHGGRTCDWVTYDKVLGEFGPDPKQARRSYRQFVAAGAQEESPSPFSQAHRGILVGSTTFIERTCEMLRDHDPDPAIPDLGRLQVKPSLESLRSVVAEEFGVATDDWARGRRSDGMSRAITAYLARRCFGYPATAVASALGYSSAGGVGQAVRRVENAGSRCRRQVQDLVDRLTNG